MPESVIIDAEEAIAFTKSMQDLGVSSFTYRGLSVDIEPTRKPRQTKQHDAPVKGEASNFRQTLFRSSGAPRALVEARLASTD